MRQILKDWCNYCEGKEDFDKSHFYTLFWDDSEEEKLTENDIDIIFSYFNEKEKLIEIMRDYLFPNKSNQKFINNVILLIQKDIEEKIRLSEKLNFISSYKISLSKIENVEKSRNEIEFLSYFDEISDVVLNNWKVEDKKANALYEALYGLTYDYEMVWYLFSPLLNLNIDFKYYYELKKQGIVYSIKNKIILYGMVMLQS